MPSILDQYRHVYNHVWDADTLSWVNEPLGGSLDERTASTPTSASVGVSSAQAVASNANRVGLDLINLSANDISLAFGASATAVLNNGVTLQPGATWFMTDRNFTTARVVAIAGGASSALSVQEYT